MRAAAVPSGQRKRVLGALGGHESIEATYMGEKTVITGAGAVIVMTRTAMRSGSGTKIAKEMLLNKLTTDLGSHCGDGRSSGSGKNGPRQDLGNEVCQNGTRSAEFSARAGGKGIHSLTEGRAANVRITGGRAGNP